MKKLYGILASFIVFTSYIMSMEQSIITSNEIPNPFTQEQMDLTKELYKKTITPQKLKELHQKGAVINGKIDYHHLEPLSHWVLSFYFHHKDEVPWTSNAYYTTKFSNLDGKKTVKDLEIITQLLELGARSTQKFNEFYPDLLQYSLSERNKDQLEILAKSRPIDKNQVEILLKSKPTLGKKELNKVWECILTKENHQYVDFLIKHCTHDEIQTGLNLCIVDQNKILENLGHPWEDCAQSLLAIMQKLLNHGAISPNNKLFHLPYNLTSFKNQETALKQLNLLCEYGAFDEKLLTDLEDLLTEIESIQGLCWVAINRMQANKAHTSL